LFQQYLVTDFKDSNPAYKYKIFIRKTAIDNAMLELLDGNQNIAGQPNENFACGGGCSAQEVFQWF